MMCKPIVLRPAPELYCASVSSNGEMIVTGSEDATVQRWCTRSGNAIGEPMHGHKSMVTCVAFSPDDEMVVTASRDKSIIRWRTANGQRIGKPLIHNDSIYGISISADGSVIVSSDTSGGLYRWNATNEQLLGGSITKEWRGHIISINDDCTKIVTWSERNQTVRFWRVGPGGTIHDTSALLVSTDIAAFAIDMNHGVAAIGSVKGAVGLCDIHE